MTSKAITVRKPLTPSTWEMISTIAPAMHQSRLFGVSNPEQAAAIMLKGYELGLSPTASFELIDVIKGKPALKPKGALALLHNHPECAGISVRDISDDNGNPISCHVRMKRRNGFEYSVNFSMEDAERAGLVKPDSNWEKYPANMLRWRAIGYCADVVFPDVLGGLLRADDYGAEITEDGDIIDGQWQESDSVTDLGNEHVPQLLQALADEYGHDAILEAAGGTLPATIGELEAVALMLAEDDYEEE